MLFEFAEELTLQILQKCVCFDHVVQQLNSTLRHRIFVLSTFEAMEQ
jgi:hypothetical protein